MKKILCFGEPLLRISSAASEERLSKGNLQLYVGGSELNVATALANWGMPVSFCTALPDNFFAKNIVRQLSAGGIGTDLIHYSGKRIGLYFLLEGKDVKDQSVIYDREGSSFSMLQPGMIDWDFVLRDVDWFHFSAITPALSSSLGEVCKEALSAARRKKITVSVDLNYRSSLWRNSKPSDIMPELASCCDIIMGNIWSANALLHIPLPNLSFENCSREVFYELAFDSAVEITKRFPVCKTVAHTFRFNRENAAVNYYAALYHNNQQFKSSEYNAPEVIDRVGTGDCFMAGLIYGLNHFKSYQETLDFATAAAFGKFMERGDTTMQQTANIEMRYKHA